MSPYKAARRRHSRIQKRLRSATGASSTYSQVDVRKKQLNNRPGLRSDLYKPLDKERREIRLLKVKAGSHRTALNCELQQAFLTSDPVPEYETISYCWGRLKKKEPISLNGREWKVPASAKAALRCMRLPNADRILWIDAVCINQEDKEERGHQVAMMYEVYSNGQGNLIYLGEDDGTTAKAIKIIDEILANAREETNGFEKWWETLRYPGGSLRFSETGIELDADLRPLFRFFSTPWFGRLWVTQEVALSRCNQCYCGQVNIGLTKVLRAAEWLKHKPQFLPFNHLDHPNMINASMLFDYCDPELGLFRTSDGFRTTLWDLLTYLRNFEAEDPKDHVYGILGLYQKLTGSSRLAKTIFPDYRKSLQSDMRDATRFIIEEEGDLNVLRMIDRFSWDVTEDRSWPSWVPHWHMKEDFDITPGLLGGFFQAADITSVEIAHVLKDIDSDRLRLRGFTIESVLGLLPVTTSKNLYNVNDTLGITKDIGRLLAKCSAIVQPNTLGATLIAGATHDRQRATKEFFSNYPTWLDYLGNTRSPPPGLGQIAQLDKEHDKDTIVASQYDHALYLAMENRRFFVTTSGYIGLGPRTMETQDIIAVVHGCKHPVVLRQHGEHYRIHGECYVHGIMDGEFVRKCKAEAKPDEEFIVV